MPTGFSHNTADSSILPVQSFNPNEKEYSRSPVKEGLILDGSTKVNLGEGVADGGGGVLDQGGGHQGGGGEEIWKSTHNRENIRGSDQAR